jgi:hypothetical protein
VRGPTQRSMRLAHHGFGNFKCSHLHLQLRLWSSRCRVGSNRQVALPDPALAAGEGRAESPRVGARGRGFREGVGAGRVKGFGPRHPRCPERPLPRRLRGAPLDPSSIRLARRAGRPSFRTLAEPPTPCHPSHPRPAASPGGSAHVARTRAPHSRRRSQSAPGRASGAPEGAAARTHRGASLALPRVPMAAAALLQPAQLARRDGLGGARRIARPPPARRASPRASPPAGLRALRADPAHRRHKVCARAPRRARARARPPAPTT